MNSFFVEKRILLFGAVIIACIVIGMGIYFLVGNRPRKEIPVVSYTIPRQVRYGFILQNKTDRSVESAGFWTYAPVKQTAYQLCENIEASYPYQLIEDTLGNQILHFTIDLMPPYATKVITIKADLLMSDSRNAIELDGSSAFLGPEKYIESDHPDIVQLARSNKAGNCIETTRNVFNFASGHIDYAGYIKKSQGALYALSQKKGDCTEFMTLFSALCRANKIPARGIGGYICKTNTILKPERYHNWAEFYCDGFWQIADPQNKVFAMNQSYYVAMRIIKEPQDNPMKGYNRFRIEGNGLHVRMN